MTQIFIREKMYSFSLRIFIGPYQEYSTDCRKRYNIPEEPQKHFGGESFLVKFDNGRAEGVIWLPRFSSDEVGDIATLCHECGHVALDVAEKIGIVPGSVGQEPLVYLHEFYFREALLKLRKLKKMENGVY